MFQLFLIVRRINQKLKNQKINNMSTSKEVLDILNLKNTKLSQENSRLKYKISKLNQSNREVRKELNVFKLSSRFKSDNALHRVTIYRRKEQATRILTAINNELSKISYVIDQIFVADKDDPQRFQNNFSIEFIDRKNSSHHTALKCLYYKDLSEMSDLSYEKFRKGMSLGQRMTSIVHLKRIRKTYSINLNLTPLSTGKF